MPGPPRVFGRYALYEPIAAGGMATVHFGRLLGPVGFSRTVAIKRLHPQFAMDPEFVAMFLDEARLAARIRHPNVIPTLDVVATEGELFLVMEYVQGEVLSRLTRRGRVPPRVAASVMCGALHGLHAAHEARSEHGEPLDIVHRDVSPQNILVGIEGTSRVLDFGVAKARGRSQSITREGQIKGKIAYMAPEQIRGSVSRQTDIYAAAVVTWEILVGRRLFKGDDDVSTMAKVLAGEVSAPSKADPELTAAFDDVIMRGLATAPSERWGTAREMALALEKCAGVASPTEVGEWVERNAADTLSQRTQMLTTIESASSKVPADPSSVAAETAEPSATGRTMQSPADPAGAAPSQTPPGISTTSATISVGTMTALGRPRSRLPYVVGALSVVVVGLVALLLRAPHGGAADSDASASTAATPTASAAPSQALPALPPPASAPPTAPAPPASASTTSSARAPSGPAGPAPTTHPGPPTPGPKPGNANCNPPYTTDAQGHRHYKMECL